MTSAPRLRGAGSPVAASGCTGSVFRPDPAAGRDDAPFPPGGYSTLTTYLAMYASPISAST